MEGFPKYTYDLLVALNEEVEAPRLPSTIMGITQLDDAALRRGIWFAAQRALVDSLIDQLIASEEEAGNEIDRDTLRSGGSLGRVLPASLDIREATVGRDEGVDSEPLVPVRHLDY